MTDPSSPADATAREVRRVVFVFSLVGGSVAGAGYGIAWMTIAGLDAGDSPSEFFTTWLESSLIAGLVGVIVGAVAGLVAGFLSAAGVRITRRMSHRRAARLIVGGLASIPGWGVVFAMTAGVDGAAAWVIIPIHCVLALSIIPIYAAVQRRAEFRRVQHPEPDVLGIEAIETAAVTEVERAPAVGDPRLRPMRVLAFVGAPAVGGLYFAVMSNIGFTADAASWWTLIATELVIGAGVGLGIGALCLGAASLVFRRAPRIGSTTAGLIVGAVAAVCVAAALLVQSTFVFGPPLLVLPMVGAVVAVGAGFVAWSSHAGRCALIRA